MNLIKDLDDFAISTDIVSRMALFSLAESCNGEAIEAIFEGIGKQLLQVYDKDKVDAMLKQYKNSALLIRKSVEQNLLQDK